MWQTSSVARSGISSPFRRDLGFLEVPSSGDQFPPVETYVSGPGEVFNLQVTTDVNQNHDWEHHVCWPISNWSSVLI